LYKKEKSCAASCEVQTGQGDRYSGGGGREHKQLTHIFLGFYLLGTKEKEAASCQAQKGQSDCYNGRGQGCHGGGVSPAQT